MFPHALRAAEAQVPWSAQHFSQGEQNTGIPGSEVHESMS
jgi:hypothetical protein